MPGREIPLVTGEYYHVLNRGVNSVPTFSTSKDYLQFLFSLEYYNFTSPPVRLSRFKVMPRPEKEDLLDQLRSNSAKYVELLAYTLMPNHFHLLLRQIKDGGISKFTGKLVNSYTRYFNTIHHRTGPLFQGKFKAVLVESEEQLIHLSRYIHLNPFVSSVVKKDQLEAYLWSSLSEYLTGKAQRCEINTVMNSFKNSEAYRSFVFDHADYAARISIVKHLALENE